MINYYEELPPEEQRKVTESIQSLYRQTFLLERRYDKKTKRYQVNREYYQCGKHMEFIKAYFAIMDIEVIENSQMGVIYIRGEQVIGEKLSKLTTLYILILKLIYDEQMSAVSTSVNAITSLGDIHEKLGSYRLLKKQPSVTEIRRSIALLKRYQLIEPLDILEEMDGQCRMVIYPTINVVLMGDDVRALIETYTEGDEEDDESEV
ncbi:MAG: DUF4194 domain-containing protein [Hungatella sp.]|jgi:hypothetical protein|nr:DUF4194 domain-containing protein [Hungatella sp.]MCI9501346.1 DUF4194 domain-containing protein [Hungatella sp.]MCI9635293.1 DUF4194 domain-containing protein [Hungatella sp.]